MAPYEIASLNYGVYGFVNIGTVQFERTRDIQAIDLFGNRLGEVDDVIVIVHGKSLRV